MFIFRIYYVREQEISVVNIHVLRVLFKRRLIFYSGQLAQIIFVKFVIVPIVITYIPLVNKSTVRLANVNYIHANFRSHILSILARLLSKFSVTK